jgi:hypothetical protein
MFQWAPEVHPPDLRSLAESRKANEAYGQREASRHVDLVNDPFTCHVCLSQLFRLEEIKGDMYRIFEACGQGVLTPDVWEMVPVELNRQDRVFYR